MRNLAITIFAMLIVGMAGNSASADSPEITGYSIQKVDKGFNDVFGELQDVIVNKGLVIDLVGHVDKMIERTAEATESVTEDGSKTPYLNAKYVLFCSADLTQKAISASPENLGICPYVIFAYETKAEPGVTHIGYRQPILGPSRTSKRISSEIILFLQTILNETAKGL